MRKRTILNCTFILSGLLFLSCNQSGINFKIVNTTNSIVDSLSISPSTGIKKNYISLLPKDSSEYFADMSGMPTQDGHYIISYKLNGKRIARGFGYFTNGYPLEKEISLKIESDTVIAYDRKARNH